MKGIQNNFKSPLFCFHGNCCKVCPTDSDFFGLSRSTRCGCCSYQVSSISVWQVTCYDHFCVFQLFSILAVPMATAVILKIPKIVCISTHTTYYSCEVSLISVQQSPRNVSDKLLAEGRKKKKKNNNNKKRSLHNMSPKLRLEDINIDVRLPETIHATKKYMSSLYCIWC